VAKKSLLIKTKFPYTGTLLAVVDQAHASGSAKNECGSATLLTSLLVYILDHMMQMYSTTLYTMPLKTLKKKLFSAFFYSPIEAVFSKLTGYFSPVVAVLS
jgi:hypothetical protein